MEKLPPTNKQVNATKPSKPKNKKQKNNNKNAKVALRQPNPYRLNKVQELTDLLSETIGYKDLLLHPEHVHNGRIPSEFGKATCTLHRHTTNTFTSNANGYAAVVFQPQFLKDNNSDRTTLLINNSAAYNAAGDFGDSCTAIPTRYQVPSGNVVAYRLVSCSVHLIPQSSLLNAAGKISFAVLTPNQNETTNGYEENTTGNSTVNDITLLSSVNNVKRSAIADICQQQAARAVYLPYDVDSFEFTKLGLEMCSGGQPRNWFSFVITGAPSHTFTIEIYSNYEIIPAPLSILAGTEEVNKSGELPSKIINGIDIASSTVIGAYRGHSDYKPNNALERKMMLSKLSVARGDYNWIDETSTEFHLPFHNYAGPGTHVLERIDRGDIPVSEFDATALVHDLEYYRDTNRKHADQHFWDNLNKGNYRGSVLQNWSAALFQVDPVNRTLGRPDIYNEYLPKAKKLLKGYKASFDPDN